MSGPPSLDLARFESALILKPSSLGDIVHTLPAVGSIKRTFPRLQLRWLCNEEWTPLLQGNPHLAEVISFPRRRFRRPWSIAALFRWIRAFNLAPRGLPEIALDFQGLLRTALLGVLRGADPVVGLSDAREGAGFFHRHAIAVRADAHAVDRYLGLARALGAETGHTLEWPLPEGAPSAPTVPRDFVLIHPHSRGRGKSLGQDALQSLCDALAPAAVVVAGRAAAPPAVAGAHVLSLVNETSIVQLIGLLRRARAIVSVDSGPMHIAAAVQPERTLGIHTWSDPRQVGPYDLRSWVWKAGRITHRNEFTDEESASTAEFTPEDARRVAAFVLQLAAS